MGAAGPSLQGSPYLRFAGVDQKHLAIEVFDASHGQLGIFGDP
jgi:hypothetical protein